MDTIWMQWSCAAAGESYVMHAYYRITTSKYKQCQPCLGLLLLLLLLMLLLPLLHTTDGSRCCYCYCDMLVVASAEKKEWVNLNAFTDKVYLQRTARIQTHIHTHARTLSLTRSDANCERNHCRKTKQNLVKLNFMECENLVHFHWYLLCSECVCERIRQCMLWWICLQAQFIQIVSKFSSKNYFYFFSSEQCGEGNLCVFEWKHETSNREFEKKGKRTSSHIKW